MEFHPIYSIVKESYTQAPHYIFSFSFHIEVTPLADGTYELTQEPDVDFSSEAQINSMDLIEVLNPNSEESKFTDSTNITEGKPRCIILLFQIMQLIIIIYLCI